MGQADKNEKTPVFIEDDPQGVILNLFIQPRSSANKISGVHSDALKIKLTAPPVDGAANKMCINFLAKLLKLPKSAVTIISGHANRSKRLLIHCPTKSQKLEIIDLLRKKI